MREEEFEGLRRPPATPYRPGSSILRVPPSALDLTLKVLRGAGMKEMCCFWYGTQQASPDVADVRAVVIPLQHQTWGNYHVPVEAMRGIHQRVAPRGFRNLAQIHSHPGARVEHSVYDDQMANSRRTVSIVFPYYGKWTGRWPTGIGVHDFQGSYWYLLNDQVAAQRVVFNETDTSVIELIDCRAKGV